MSIRYKLLILLFLISLGPLMVLGVVVRMDFIALGYPWPNEAKMCSFTRQVQDSNV